MNNVTFRNLTKEDLKFLNYPIHSLNNHSLKVIITQNEYDKEIEKIIGYIIIDDVRLSLTINEYDNENLNRYKSNINNTPSYLLREIYINENYREEGILEELFDKVSHSLPHTSIIWYKETELRNKDLIKQIGGFVSLPYGIDDDIYVFSYLC